MRYTVLELYATSCLYGVGRDTHYGTYTHFSLLCYISHVIGGEIFAIYWILLSRWSSGRKWDCRTRSLRFDSRVTKYYWSYLLGWIFIKREDFLTLTICIINLSHSYYHVITHHIVILCIDELFAYQIILLLIY